MTVRRKLALVLVVLVCFWSLIASGCCLTNSMWDSVADRPLGIEDAAITEDHVLHLAVRYEDGGVQHVKAQLFPDPDWTDATATIVGPLEGKLPPSTHTWTDRWLEDAEPGKFNVSYRYHSGIKGDTEYRVWVEGAGCKCTVDLPEPVDWGTVTPYLAALVSPVTFVVDLVSAPIWVAWVVMTAGGHGPCWLPWCTPGR